MRIALDFDGTYTEDEILWAAFVNKAKERGHYVAFVTARKDDGYNQELEAAAQMLAIDIVYCDARPKSECFKADVWIDDNPLWIPTHQGMRDELRMMDLGG